PASTSSPHPPPTPCRACSRAAPPRGPDGGRMLADQPLPAAPVHVTVLPPSPAALPPGPRRPAFLQSLRYVRRPYEAVEESGRLFGNCFTARPLAQPPTVIF